MADTEAVVDALRARRKRGEAAALLDAAEPLTASGQDLVWIGLMPTSQIRRSYGVSKT